MHYVAYRRPGNAVAGIIRIELKAAVDELKATYGVVPGLAVVLVGNRRLIYFCYHALMSSTTALVDGVATLPKASRKHGTSNLCISITINKRSGARRDSATYVRMKKKACTEIGIASFGTDFEADVTQEQLIAKIDELNAGTASMI